MSITNWNRMHIKYTWTSKFYQLSESWGKLHGRLNVLSAQRYSFTLRLTFSVIKENKIKILSFIKETDRSRSIYL